jgi:hypothetical protein
MIKINIVSVTKKKINIVSINFFKNKIKVEKKYMEKGSLL